MKIAIIGSGIAGLSTAFYLASDHEITLFEAEGRLGGHTNTVPVVLSGKTHHVDTGFIVHNEKNYPLFRDFLQQLGVETQDADMSFSVSHQQPFLEFSGTGPRGLFAQPKNLVSPTFWKLLVSIARFGRLGRKMLRQPPDGAEDKEETVAEFLIDTLFQRASRINISFRSEARFGQLIHVPFSNSQSELYSISSTTMGSSRL